MSALALTNKNVVVVGMGLTGLSCVRFLLAKGANVVAMDSRQELSIQLEVPLFLGELNQKRLTAADVIVVSPGVDLNTPAIQAALDAKVKVIGDIELFAQFNSTPVIAITGSNGKTTVTHLVAEMCAAAGKKVLMGGNVGVPALELLNQDADVIVLELSSFQLDTTFSLHSVAATVLNLSEDHLDRHGSLANYQQAKLKVFQNTDHVVLNRDDALAQPNSHACSIDFGLSESNKGFSWNKESASICLDGQPFINSSSCLLAGDHNMLNIQAAAALAMKAGIDVASIKKAAMAFGGLPHRCETVSVHNGVRWINDSKATNVGATIAAINGLHIGASNKLILIAGGEGKGADFSPLAASLQKAVNVLITLGKDGDKIAQLKEHSFSVSTMEEAVKLASQHAVKNDVVLLSPACASLDMFANYQERGNCFTHAVKELAA